jgi:hypothetical protein
VRRRTDEMWESYLTRSGGWEMFDKEPSYRMQMEVLRDWVHQLGIVLEDEGVPDELAERILRGVLYGSPNVADAEQRMRDHEAMMDLLKRSAMSGKFTLTDPEPS